LKKSRRLNFSKQEEEEEKDQDGDDCES